MGPLGRLIPPDWEHIEKHPLTLTAAGLPGSLGINWYDGYDNPIKGADGRFRVRISGSIRGGHCIAAEQAGGTRDAWKWHVFYDQGSEGACTGFGTSRALTLVTGRTYNAFWLYDDARRLEGGFPDQEGAYVRDAFKAAVKWADHYQDGEHCRRVPWKVGVPGRYIKAYKWITDAETLRQSLGYSASTNEIPLLNSWGTSYPETVYASLDDISRLLSEEGEVGVPLL